MKRELLKTVLGILLLFPAAVYAQNFDELLDGYCLRLCYPQLVYETKDRLIRFKNGAELNYADDGEAKTNISGSIKNSMAQLYPLEPERPDTPKSTAPGRVRPYRFFNNFYGHTPEEVKKNLRKASFLGKSFPLAKQAADAFARVAIELERLAKEKPYLHKFLVPEGGYYWRKIAGESRLSAHSYGIALDIGVKASPYWRWSGKMPHPLQKTYPSEIVEAFENNGFIWGGKWHEYDLMHYEYRPELICKSRMSKFAAKPFAVKLPH